jgi:hypothetical protein
MDEAIPIKDLIHELRGQKVMIDSDLAKLYQVDTKVLNQAVKRNIKRFPDDFMFQLTKDEWGSLRSQIVTFEDDIRKYRPYVFTEHGILMLSSVLKSDIALEINIKIMRVFVQVRQQVFSQFNAHEQLGELRTLLMLYIEKNDKRVTDIVRVLNSLVASPQPKSSIGFKAE